MEVRTVVVGNGGVGKSTLVIRFIQGQFIEELVSSVSILSSFSFSHTLPLFNLEADMTQLLKIVIANKSPLRVASVLFLISLILLGKRITIA